MLGACGNIGDEYYCCGLMQKRFSWKVYIHHKNRYILDPQALGQTVYLAGRTTVYPCP